MFIRFLVKPTLAAHLPARLPRWTGAGNSLDFVFVDIPTMPNPENQNIFAGDRINNPIIFNAIFAESGKLPLKNWARLRFMRQFALNLLENSGRLCSAEVLEVTLDRFLENDIIDQETSSVRCRKWLDRFYHEVDQEQFADLHSLRCKTQALSE